MKHASVPATVGLLALATAALSPATHAIAAQTYQLKSTLPVAIVPSVADGQADAFLYSFGPLTTTSFAPAKLVADSFVQTGNWQIDPLAFLAGTNNTDPNDPKKTQGHYGFTLDSNNQVSAVSLYNNGAATTVTVPTLFGIPIGTPTASSPDDGKKSTTPTLTSIFLPFSSVGSKETLNLSYFDDPTPSVFSLTEFYTDPTTQKAVTKVVLAGTFNGNGTFTPNSVPGVPGSPAVPEPSSFALLGLGLLPVALIARKRTRVA